MVGDRKKRKVEKRRLRVKYHLTSGGGLKVKKWGAQLRDYLCLGGGLFI